MCVAVVESHSFEASSLFAWIMLVGGQDGIHRAYISSGCLERTELYLILLGCMNKTRIRLIFLRD